MTSTRAPLTGHERRFAADEIIVSKTDLKGVITYANDVFLRVSGFSESELLGRPHNIVRHPDMPRCVYRLLWERIKGGHEIFAYVVNRARNGDHYWVLAHVTPLLDADGTIAGYHSSRRLPERRAVEAAIGLYAALREEEARHRAPSDAMAASAGMLDELLRGKGMSYDEFVLGL
ncbi:PAS domain-containing protein [Azospirillum agricola]|uniref:PAS domain-containing protein n=1 Tax=Azospirillum agricola TaxID=1720247 RepID=UPI000A0F0D49|nr:PAS domain-containing protein [Azospirillum agricola]SMH59841.1 PAS domain S-box-containing protein [Azospirillum lipoferum]